MTYNFFDLLQLVGSLGIFIYGLQKVAGNKLRSILKGMTSTRFRGLLTGFTATTITQSFFYTTVMVVSFLKAGLMTFVESTGVIMGANIGTTITAWMISIFGFKMQITPIAIMLIGIFFPFMFFGREKLRNLPEAMIGFGIQLSGWILLRIPYRIFRIIPSCLYSWISSPNTVLSPLDFCACRHPVDPCYTIFIGGIGNYTCDVVSGMDRLSDGCGYGAWRKYRYHGAGEYCSGGGGIYTPNGRSDFIL